MPHIVVLGEALIDAFAESGTSLRDARTLHPRPGGAPANVAVALACLGADVGFIGKVGADDYGAWLIELLHSRGVDTTHFMTDAHAPTMLAIVAVPIPSEQQFILYNGANALLRVEDLPQATIAAARVFVYGSVTLAADSRGAALQAAHWAREAGHHVVFDVNLRPSLWPDLEIARSYIREGVASASVVKLNQVELEFLTGVDDAEPGSRQLVEQGAGLCCVSLGENGAYFDNGAACGYVPALDVTVTDTTGSGDAFVAGLALQVGQLEKSLPELTQVELYDIVRFANVCGGLAATQEGAMSQLPSQREVEWMLGAAGSRGE